jgi:hypothetical protein
LPVPARSGRIGATERGDAMKKAVLFSTAAALLAVAGTAMAREPDKVVTTGPSRGMLHSGIVTLGISYVPAVVVAASSDRSADKRLYLPLAGPWLDLGQRDCPACSHETLNKALLITDGIVQGLGALDIVGAFFFVETRTEEASNAEPPSIRIAPTRIAGGYGLTAIGSF